MSQVKRRLRSISYLGGRVTTSAVNFGRLSDSPFEWVAAGVLFRGRSRLVPSMGWAAERRGCTAQCGSRPGLILDLVVRSWRFAAGPLERGVDFAHWLRKACATVLRRRVLDDLGC